MIAILNSDKHDRGGRTGVSLHLRRVAVSLLVAAMLYAVMAPRVLERQRGRRLQALNGQLASAVETGDVAAASQSLRAGADPNARRSDGRLLIYIAEAKADIPMLELLIDAGAEYHAPKILMTAIRNHSPNLVRRLLEAGANPDSGIGTSPLLACIGVGAVDLAEMLLEAGADVELEGNTIGLLRRVGRVRPLHAAILSSEVPRERLAMVQLLLDRGADPEAESGSRTAMDDAVATADEQLIDLLRGYGGRYGPREAAALGRIDELQEMLHRDPAVLTAAYRPITASLPDESATLLGVAIYLAQVETARFLIDAGAPLNTREALGRTPLYLAVCHSGDADLVRRLIERGAEVDARDRYGDTPLIDGAYFADVEIIAALVEAGADVNAQGHNGKTALHRAVQKDRNNVVEVLLAAGADPTIPDSEGKLPIDLAGDRDSPLAKRLAAAAD